MINKTSLIFILATTSTYAAIPAATTLVPYNTTDCHACKKDNPTNFFCNDNNKQGYCCPFGITNSPMCKPNGSRVCSNIDAPSNFYYGTCFNMNLNNRCGVDNTNIQVNTTVR